MSLEATLPASALVHFLKGIPSGAGFVGRAKIAYRPYICPFGELLAFVEKGDRVFDVGCGSGQFCLLLARFAAPSWIGGVEISDTLIRNARQLFENAAVAVPHRFETYDGATFPPMLAEADRVFLVDVLHHVPPAAQQRFLVSLHAGMKPGATLILKDIDGASPLVWCNKFHDLLLAGEIGAEIPARKLRSDAEQAGFTVRHASSRRMWWYPHHTLVLQR